MKKTKQLFLLLAGLSLWGCCQVNDSDNKTPAATTYAVTYGVNGATSGTAPAAQIKTQGTNLTLAKNTGNLAKTGYSFAGWNTKADGTGTDYVAGASYTTDAGLSLYAKWTHNTYTVTFDKNAADASGTMASQSFTSGKGQALTSNTFARAGYTFTGWNTKADGTGTDYDVGASYTTDAGLSLYAKWTANSYTINYKDSGDVDFTGSTTGLPTNHTYGTATTLIDATREGYTFGGWFTDSACSTPKVTTLAADGYTADITLYAKWVDSTAPAKVIGLASTSSNTQVTLTWKNPSDADFEKATITWAASTAAEIQLGTVDVNGTASEDGTYTVTGLTNGTSYTFTVKAVDSTGNKSVGVSVTRMPTDKGSGTVGLNYASLSDGCFFTQAQFSENYGDVYKCSAKTSLISSCNLAGAKIKFSYNEKTVYALVTDMGPDEYFPDDCSFTLEEAAFRQLLGLTQLADLSTGKITNATWQVVPCDTGHNLAFYIDSSSTDWWISILPIYQRYPIAKFEYSIDGGTNYNECIKDTSNPKYSFSITQGLSGTYTIRTTDIYGTQIVNTITLDGNDKTYEGTCNFE